MVSVVLWHVENPGNVGAIARLCANFEVDELLFIEPRCNPLDQVAKNRAKHAQYILEESRIIESSELKKFDLAIATTAQIGTDFNLHRSSIPPKKLNDLIANRKNVALVFGPESHGLSNEQIAMCDSVAHIPTNPEYPVMNLSHAVAVLLFSLFDSSSTPHEPVGREELRVMNEFIDDIVQSLEFTTEDKQQTQKQVWKNVFAKSNMTKREAFAVLGLLAKIRESKSNSLKD